MQEFLSSFVREIFATRDRSLALLRLLTRTNVHGYYALRWSSVDAATQALAELKQSRGVDEAMRALVDSAKQIEFVRAPGAFAGQDVERTLLAYEVDDLVWCSIDIECGGASYCGTLVAVVRESGAASAAGAFRELEGLTDFVSRLCGIDARRQRVSSTRIFSAADKRCRACEAPATNHCARCHLTFYCTRRCQEVDWRRHRGECRTILHYRDLLMCGFAAMELGSL